MQKPRRRRSDRAGRPAMRSPRPQAAERTVEFFTAQIRNPHTRAAYAAAVTRVFTWCDARGLALAELSPILIDASSGYSIRSRWAICCGLHDVAHCRSWRRP